MTYNNLLNRVLGAAAGAVALSVVTMSAAEAATINSFRFNFSGNGGNRPSYEFNEGSITTVATATRNGNFRNVSQSRRGLGVDRGPNNDINNRELLNLNFSRAVQLSSARFSLVDNSDDAEITVDGQELFSGDLSRLVSFASNEGISFDFGGLDRNDDFRLKGVEVFHYADGSSVPEPMTIIATLMGGSAVLGMRKKLSSSDSAADS